MTQALRKATSATLVAVLLAGPGLAAARDATRIIVGAGNGNLGLGLSYRDGGYRSYPRYDQRYRYRYYAPPPYYGYGQGYRDGYRDGRWTQHRGGPGRHYRDYRDDRRDGRWDRHERRRDRRDGW